MEIAYLAKGVANLEKVIVQRDDTSELEAVFRKRLLAHLNSDHELLGRFDPYASSKLLRYLLTYNDSSEVAIEVYKSLSLLLT